MAILLLIHFLISRDRALSFVDLLIFSIALTVGVIPEALPLVTTFSLSSSAKKLAKQNVVVKRLTSVEDLGSIQVLCTDKTGTITENKLTVADTLALDKKLDVVFSSCLAVTNIHEQQELPNNAFDLSLVASLNEAAMAEVRSYQLISELPFDPNRRRNSALVEKEGRHVLVTRGSPEEMIALDQAMSKDEKTMALEWIAAQGKLGRRTLAVSIWEEFQGDQYDERYEADHIRVRGIISFVDALKPMTKKVVEEASTLGVRLVVLTGDDPVVAGAVAVEAGIINKPDAVITGASFDRMMDSEKETVVETTQVFARVSPKQKYEILALLMEKYQTGFLGEGINDAPALKLAHVSLVVESAADIARESADIILLQQDLGVIIEGIFEGRRTFHNTVNYIRATLLSNFGNFYAVAFASLLIPYLPMLPVQILLLNLLSDFPMFSISTDNVNLEDLQSPKIYNTKDIILVATVLGIVSTLFDFIIFSVFQRYEASVLQTSWFIGSIATELVLLFSIRTNRVFYRAGAAPSKIIILLSTAALTTAVVLPFTAFGQRMFHFVRPTPDHLGILLLITVGYFATTEVVKNLYYRLIDEKQEEKSTVRISLMDN
jgi:Mg2+-importing ATPase